MISDARSVVSSSLREALPYARSESGIFLGRIVAVHEETSSADIYIMDLSITLKNVPFSFPSKNNSYGAMFMPGEVNSVCIVLITNSGHRYIISSANVNDANTWMKILQGEQSIYSIGKSFFKQDVGGNTISSGGMENYIVQKKDGVNLSHSNGIESKTINSKTVSGFRLWNNESLLSGNTLNLLHKSEFYSKISVPKVYAIDEIVSNGVIDQTIKSSIISSIASTMDIITNTEYGLYKRLSDIKSSAKNTSLSDGDWMTAINASISSFLNQYLLPVSGTKAVIEFGNAVDKDIDNIADINDIVESDYAKSDQDNNLAMRLLFSDSVTQDTKGFLSVDSDGNMEINFNRIKMISTVNEGVSINGVTEFGGGASSGSAWYYGDHPEGGNNGDYYLAFSGIIYYKTGGNWVETGINLARDQKLPVSTKTNTALLTDAEFVVVCDKATSMTINLPEATGSGHKYHIKNINAGVVTIDADGSDIIDGDTTVEIYQWESIQILDYAAHAWIIL